MKTLLALLVCLMVVMPARAASVVTPHEWLALQEKPQFKPGHRLQHLTTFSWPFAFEMYQEMATNWGYALELGWAYPDSYADLADTNSRVAKILTLATNYPDKFVVAMGLWRTIDSFTNPPVELYCTNSAGLFAGYTGAGVTNTFTEEEFQMSKTNGINLQKVFSPEAPDYIWEAVSKNQTYWLKQFNDIVPIKIFVNGGEYGLGVVGSSEWAWRQDPRVQAQPVMTDPYDWAWDATNAPGTISWPHYASMRKGRELNFLYNEINNILTNRESYTFYATGNEANRYYHWSVPNWQETEAKWGWWSDVMLTNIDIPCYEAYYVYPQSYTNATGTTMFMPSDLLTLRLNAVRYDMEIGYPTNIAYVSGGWSNTDTNAFSSIERYQGFLKCVYMAGAVTTCAGYFSVPNGASNSIYGSGGFSGSFWSENPPHWLQQIEVMSRVHAQFSWLDDHIYEGALISGPQRHLKSADKPAMEFTNTVADATCRVLARKKTASNEWLICAWAAHGDARNVTVNIPDLGDVTVTASPSGNLYRGTPGPVVRLLDATGQYARRTMTANRWRVGAIP